MENQGDKRNQGDLGQGQRQGGMSKPGKQPGKDTDRERGGQEPSKQGGQPNPSGVPNEGKGTPGQPGSNDDRGRNVQSGYEYKGGRQSTGGIPNPDDRDDDKSAGSFRGTAEEPDGGDDDDVERGPGAGQKSDLNQNGRTREQNENPNQRRGRTPDDKTRNPA